MNRLKWLIYLLSFFMTINFTTPVFASFCQLEHGLSSAEITSLFAVFSLSVFLFEIPTGLLSDRMGENNSLIVGATLTALATFLFINGTTVFLYLGEFIFGLASTFFSGPFDSILYKYCKDSKGNLDFDTIVSKSYSLQWIALCFSFLGCYIISKNGSLVQVFWATFIANIVLLLIVSLLPRIKADTVQTSGISLILKRYSSQIISNKQLLTVCLLNIFFLIVLVTGYQILQPYLLHSSLSESNNGLLYFVAAIFASGGAYFYNRLKDVFSSLKVLISLCLALISLCMFGLGITSTVVFIFVLVCVYRLVWGITSPMFSSLVNQTIDDDAFRNTAFSIISLGGNLGSSILLFLFPLINISVEKEYLILGALCIALLCICLIFKQIYHKIQ